MSTPSQIAVEAAVLCTPRNWPDYHSLLTDNAQNIQSAIDKAVEAAERNQDLLSVVNGQQAHLRQMELQIVQFREALTCAGYALTHPLSNQSFAIAACEEALSASAPPIAWKWVPIEDVKPLLDRSYDGNTWSSKIRDFTLLHADKLKPA